MKPDEELIYGFCTVLQRRHFIDNALFERAVATLGETGVIDLAAVSGYYTLVSMVLNVAEVPPATSRWEIAVVTGRNENEFEMIS
jgi:4-carboxymuconolactone decarboxylase